MPLNAANYMSFSELSYLALDESMKNKTLGYLIDNKKVKENDLYKPTLSPLLNPSNPLRSYKLINFSSDSATGFTVAAFQNPETGEIVFSFKGTDIGDLSELFKDVAHADEQIFTGLTNTIPGQFAKAEAFVGKILSENPNTTSYSFTGHSLGGALAQYMTYKTGQPSTTFNAPGIGSVIESVTGQAINYEYYKDKSFNYANESDIVGNFRNHARIGTNILIQSNLNSKTSEDITAVLTMDAVNTLPINGLEKALITKRGLESLKRLQKNAAPLSGNHGMEDLLNDSGEIMPQSNDRPMIDHFVSELVEGTSIAYSGAKFAIVTIGEIEGELIYYMIDGAKKFIKTSVWVAKGLAYYSAEGVQKFIKTTGDIAGEVAYFTIDSTGKFIESSGNAIADSIWGGYTFLRGLFSDDVRNVSKSYNSATAAPPVDPLILDLNGDGQYTISLERSSAYFDLDASGFAERAAWVDPNDGLLVLDRNGDGMITNGQELFGDQTILINGKRAMSGFEALAEFDLNKDGKIDANDVVYAKLRVWQDMNQDGISQAEELKSLADVNISVINLHSTDANVTDAMGNIQRRLGSFVRSDGSGGQIAEYLLNRDTLDSVDLFGGDIEIPDEILALPNLQGAGNMTSLHVAMAKDESGVLKQLVIDMINPENASTRQQIFADILHKWAGVEAIDPKSRGTHIDARQLAVLEKFMGTSFVGTNGANPNVNAAPLLKEAYAKLFSRLYASIAGETFLKEVLNKVNYTVTEAGLLLDLSELEQDINMRLESDAVQGRQVLSDVVRTLRGYNLMDNEKVADFIKNFALKSSELANVVYGSYHDESIIGDEGDNSLSGGTNDDYIVGGAGNDTLYGNAGNDTLVGGGGKDRLEGGVGDDVYIFNKGDGEDNILDYGGVDTIKFGKGISPDDVDAKRVMMNYSAHLVLSIKGTTDKLTVERYFGDGSYWGLKETEQYQIEKIEFVDGTVWTTEDIYQKVHNVTGTEANDWIAAYDNGDVIYRGLGGNDTLTGKGGNDELYGDDGDDNLYGNEGNDILAGGAGTDSLRGGLGDDTYIFNRGDGVDTIYESDGFDTVRFGDNISPSDITTKMVNTRDNEISLELAIKDTLDKLIINLHFGKRSYSSPHTQMPQHQIEQVVFADGTTWDLAEFHRRTHNVFGTSQNDSWTALDDAPFIYHGLDGNDSIYGGVSDDQLFGDAGDDYLSGGKGNDILAGGTGKDTLYGGAGDDTYLFNRGDGVDTIYEENGGGFDIIRFGEGVKSSDVAARVINRNNILSLELSIKGTDDKLIVEKHFGYYSYYYPDTPSPINQIEQIVFDDGETWDIDEIYRRAHEMFGSDGNDSIGAAGSESVTIYGLGGDDNITGSRSNDFLYGGDGDDQMGGGRGDDIYVGGRGNDIMGDDDGDDTYIFNLGDGKDTIYDYGGTDTVQFGAGISPEDITLKRVVKNNDYNLEIGIKGTDDTITVVGYFGRYNVYGRDEASPQRMIEKISFANGVVWTQDTIYDIMHERTGTDGDDIINAYDNGGVTYYGLGGNDVLNGANGDDRLYGGDGDDRLDGRDGNDLFVGGRGDDILSSYMGNDTYIFNRGDGRDIISDYGGADVVQFGPDIKPDDVEFKLERNNYDYDLAITIKGTEDKILIKNHVGSSSYGSPFYASPNRSIEKFMFADGTILTKEDVDDKLHNLIGTDGNDSISAYDKQDVYYRGLAGNDNLTGGAGNDRLYGDDGDDTLDGRTGNDILAGGAGNDKLYGGEGDDIYVFNRGDGQDEIYDYYGANTVRFGDDISPDDIMVDTRRRNNYLDLVLRLRDTDDQIIVQEHFSSNNNKLSWVEFADGTKWSTDDMMDKAHNIYGSKNNDIFQAFDDKPFEIHGGTGNDSIYGRSGNDILYGDDGDDTIDAREGDDVLVGGTGNDKLNGSLGNDKYIFNAGDGADTVFDTGGTSDEMSIGYEYTDVIFRRDGSDLLVSMLNSSDSIKVSLWYWRTDYRIETINSASGHAISHTQVDQLVQVMASFSRDNGMSWEQALTERPDQVRAILQEYWTVPTT